MVTDPVLDVLPVLPPVVVEVVPTPDTVALPPLGSTEEAVPVEVCALAGSAEVEALATPPVVPVGSALPAVGSDALAVLLTLPVEVDIVAFPVIGSTETTTPAAELDEFDVVAGITLPVAGSILAAVPVEL